MMLKGRHHEHASGVALFNQNVLRAIAMMNVKINQSNALQTMRFKRMQHGNRRTIQKANPIARLRSA